MGRGDIDDAPEPGFPHHRQGETRGVESGGEVERKDQVPLFRRELDDRRHVLHPGIVHQNVDPAAGTFDCLKEADDCVGLGKVGARIGDLDAEILSNAGANARDLVGVAETVEHHVSALLGERSGDPEPDTASGAGNEGASPCERGRGRLLECGLVHHGLLGRPKLGGGFEAVLGQARLVLKCPFGMDSITSGHFIGRTEMSDEGA